MRTKEELSCLRDQALALRRTGKSRREIKEMLQVGNSTLNTILKGEPAPGWTDPFDSQPLARQAMHDYWVAERASREAGRADIREAARSQIGELTDREVLIAGAIAYWCEGSKSKPYRQDEEVSFINSDPGLILLFLRFLEKADIPRHRLRYSVHIHENGDLAAATHWWAELVEATDDQFVGPVIKHHEPRTAHDGSTAEYRGCLQVRVLKGTQLYRKIAGWAQGTMRAA
jgi:hypothetical protein